jgi:hypothetical protein
MAETRKCAHLGCNCEVEEGGPWGKYCSPLCQEAGDESSRCCASADIRRAARRRPSIDARLSSVLRASPIALGCETPAPNRLRPTPTRLVAPPNTMFV